MATIPGARPYDGMLSNVGMIVWATGSAVAVFTALMLRAADLARARSKVLLVGGVVTAVLLLDDLFMLHDVLFPEFFAVPELLATGLVGLAPVAFFAKCWRDLRCTPWPVLSSESPTWGLWSALTLWSTRWIYPATTCGRKDPSFSGFSTGATT